MATQVARPSALPDGLRYYLLRGNVMVPLVPIDQLPFQLHGVPRQLTHRQMSDENWKLLHETEYPATSLSIQAPSSFLPSQPAPLPRPRFLAPDHHVRNESTNTVEETSQPKRWLVPAQAIEKVSVYPHGPQINSFERPSSLTDSFASIYHKDAQRLGYRMPYPSGIEPDPSKKEFCTHWIKTGECAFTSVGCKYKHEMPTMDRLRELGFTQLPKWWKEKSAITARGPTWMQRRLASGNEDNDYSGEMSAPRAFPDPSTFRTRQADEHDLPHEGSQARSILQRNITPEQATTLRLSPLPAPMPEATVRRESQISNLLIDLDEAPAPPPSPQLSNCSSTNVESCDTQIPYSRTSVSPPPSPLAARLKSEVVDCATVNEVTKKKRKEKELSGQPTVRRHSLISWASDSEDDVPPMKPLSKYKNTSRRATQRSNPPAKQLGLAHSKHAADNNNINQDKAAEVHGKRANRRTSQRKGNDIGAIELHTKIDQLRRNAHHKERTRKGVVGELAAAPVAVKQLPN